MKGNLEELTKLFNDNWVPMRETPAHIGGDYGSMAWLIMLEREIVLELIDEPKDLTAKLKNTATKAQEECLSEESFLEQLQKM